MDCPECGAPTVAFAVPADLREHAPGEAAAICTRCLRVRPADAGPADPEFRPLAEFFPDGEAGVALALALGLLGSLALNRDAVESLLGRAERAGADPFLTLDRLAAAGRVDPHFDLPRRRDQLEQLL